MLISIVENAEDSESDIIHIKQPEPIITGEILDMIVVKKLKNLELHLLSCKLVVMDVVMMYQLICQLCVEQLLL